MTRSGDVFWGSDTRTVGLVVLRGQAVHLRSVQSADHAPVSPLRKATLGVARHDQCCNLRAFGQQPDRFRVPGTGAHQAGRGDGYNSFAQHHWLPISSVTSQLNRRAAPGVLSRLGAARFWFSQVSTAIFALYAHATRLGKPALFISESLPLGGIKCAVHYDSWFR